MPWIEVSVIEELRIMAVYRIEAETTEEAVEEVREGKPTHHSSETLSRIVK